MDLRRNSPLLPELIRGFFGIEEGNQAALLTNEDKDAFLAYLQNVVPKVESATRKKYQKGVAHDSLSLLMHDVSHTVSLAARAASSSDSLVPPFFAAEPGYEVNSIFLIEQEALAGIWYEIRDGAYPLSLVLLHPEWSNRFSEAVTKDGFYANTIEAFLPLLRERPTSVEAYIRAYCTFFYHVIIKAENDHLLQKLSTKWSLQGSEVKTLSDAFDTTIEHLIAAPCAQLREWLQFLYDGRANPRVSLDLFLKNTQPYLSTLAPAAGT